MPYKTVTGEQIDKNTWYLNLPAGVTGGVSDVKFNGKSVVNSDGVADIKFPAAYVYGIDTDLTNLTCDVAAKQVYLNYVYDDDKYPASLRYIEAAGFGALPAHNFKRFVGHGRQVNYWLDANDSTKKEDGTTAVLTGADGDVLVWIPIVHVRYDNYTDANGHAHTVRLWSDTAFNGSRPHTLFYCNRGGTTAKPYICGAFKAVMCDADGVPIPQTAENTPITYANGRRCRSVIGARPATNSTRANMRKGFENNGDYTNVHFLFGSFLKEAMAIEHGNWNEQTTFSVGFTNLSTYYYAALRKNGRTVIFGNGSGQVEADDLTDDGLDVDILTMKDGATDWNSTAQNDHTKRIVACSYRGIENPFGACWEFCDGIQKNQSATANDYTISGYWMTTDCDTYSRLDTAITPPENGVGTFPVAGCQNPQWVHHEWPKAIVYIADYAVETLFAIHSSWTASDNKSLADYFYNNGNAGACVVVRGGSAYSSAAAGTAYVTVSYGLATAYATYGARLAVC